ncbi:MAG: T9SS type A sorting domain-containing protein [Bacteroidetes bacterium]|nr:T9SS type A sorting domain-containing protein [Bacteroidota bacterium]
MAPYKGSATLKTPPKELIEAQRNVGGNTLAGPANDNCNNAIAITQLDGTCNVYSSSGATYDVGVFGCMSGSKNVWFSFVAQGPNYAISVNAPSFYPELAIFTASDPCNGATITGINCVSGWNSFFFPTQNFSMMNNAGPPLTIGQTYYVMMTSYSGTGSYTLCVKNPLPNIPGTDCATSTLLCSNSTIAGNSNLWGNTQELSSNTIGDCLGKYGEINSSWYVLNIQTGGTLTFTIAPTNGTDDYDFEIWKGATCFLGAPVRCNYSSTIPNTGLNSSATGTSVGASGSAWCKQLTVAAGDVYILLINGFTPTSSSFNMNFGGTAILGCTLPVILPVQLLNYKGELTTDGYTELNWATAIEQNADYYLIEKSTDGLTYTELDKIKAVGNSTKTSNYTAYDKTPEKGLNYYKLTEFDKNGESTFLGYATVNNHNTAERFGLYPNPVQNVLNLQFANISASAATCELYNAQGVLVKTEEFLLSKGSATYIVDVSTLEKGLYFVKTTGANRVWHASFIKQ